MAHPNLRLGVQNWRAGPPPLSPQFSPRGACKGERAHVWIKVLLTPAGVLTEEMK